MQKPQILKGYQWPNRDKYNTQYNIMIVQSFFYDKLLYKNIKIAQTNQPQFENSHNMTYSQSEILLCGNDI